MTEPDKCLDGQLPSSYSQHDWHCVQIKNTSQRFVAVTLGSPYQRKFTVNPQTTSPWYVFPIRGRFDVKVGKSVGVTKFSNSEPQQIIEVTGQDDKCANGVSLCGNCTSKCGEKTDTSKCTTSGAGQTCIRIIDLTGNVAKVVNHENDLWCIPHKQGTKLGQYYSVPLDSVWVAESFDGTTLGTFRPGESPDFVISGGSSLVGLYEVDQDTTAQQRKTKIMMVGGISIAICVVLAIVGIVLQSKQKTTLPKGTDPDIAPLLKASAQEGKNKIPQMSMVLGVIAIVIGGAIGGILYAVKPPEGFIPAEDCHKTAVIPDSMQDKMKYYVTGHVMCVDQNLAQQCPIQKAEDVACGKDLAYRFPITWSNDRCSCCDPNYSECYAPNDLGVWEPCERKIHDDK